MILNCLWRHLLLTSTPRVGISHWLSAAFLPNFVFASCSRMDESLLNANTSEEKSDKNQARASSDTVDENPSLYYFESDHLALKGNPDYHNLLRVSLI